MTRKRKTAIITALVIAAAGIGTAAGIVAASSNYWPNWCASHPNRHGVLYQAHCVPSTTTTTVATTTTTTTVPVTTTTTEPTTTTTTPASGSAYVISCQPTGDPLNVTLGQPGVDYYPHAYDGSVAGAQAFVDANGGQCWQTYYVGGN